MPIEIKELIIKINVEEQTNHLQQDTNLTSLDKEAIIEECIDRVIAEIEYRLSD
ncbi:DUF5908 family protein [uncultured Microscilla sp.]|uniref:DUF5908 family protein n=1 Tax=uncultured Microscilla sp. TaxID=432653 RepID=UPI00262A2BB8|nr:DUF5908 family protein [uncultured Microscilla sp.]